MATMRGPKRCVWNFHMASAMPRSSHSTPVHLARPSARDMAAPPVAARYTQPFLFMASATSGDMPPLPMTALIPNLSMNSASSLFMRADVVGPAATTVHPLSVLRMMGPQWNIADPMISSGTSLPSWASSRARMCISSLPVMTGP